MRSASLDQLTKNTNILNDFDKDSVPVLTDSAAATIPQLTDLTKVATPLLGEMTRAIIPSIEKYTEQLRKYNAEGGSYPTPPRELIAFGQGHLSAYKSKSSRYGSR